MSKYDGKDSQERGILTDAQLIVIKLMVYGDGSPKGLTQKQVARAGNTAEETIRRWKTRNQHFIKALIAEKQHKLRNMDVTRLAEGVKIKDKLQPSKTAHERDKKKKALEDFDYFRKVYLDRKSWKVQSSWVKHIANNDYPVIVCPGRHGKSLTVVDYLTWLIVRDRSILVGLFSKASFLVEMWLSKIKYNLQIPAIVRDFGQFMPEKPDKWTQSEIIVIRPDLPSESQGLPTVLAAGIGSQIFGNKFNVVVLDDICDNQNSGTELQRQKLVEVVSEAIIPACQSTSTIDKKIITIGTPMHPFDFLNWATRNPGFQVRIDRAINWETKKILAPEGFNITYFKEKLASMGTRSFNKRFQCHAVLDDDVIFLEEWFRDGRCHAKKFAYGEVPAGCRTVISVDPAVSQRKGSSNLAIVATAFKENSPFRHTIDYYDDKLRVDLQASKMVDMYQIYDAEVIVIEANACQAYLRELVDREARSRGFNINIAMTHTGMAKLADSVGVERVAPGFEHGNHKLPYLRPQDRQKTQRLSDILAMSTLNDVPDMLMAMWFAEQYIQNLAKKQVRIHDMSTMQPWYLGGRRRNHLQSIQ